MTLSTTFAGNDDFKHLAKLALKVPQPSFSGAWSTIELQPDVFTPQRFTIGIAVQSPNDRLYFKLLDEFKKFECVYGDRFPQKFLREIIAHAEETLRQAVQKQQAIPEIIFETSCLSISAPSYTSGEDRESTVERLFSELVVMAPHAKKAGDGFESMDTPHVRALVNEELKRIAQMDFEKIVVESNQGILIEEDGVKHFLDLNLRTARACGSVVSAVYKTPTSVELNLLKSSRDLTTYSRVRNLSDIGLFLLLPHEESLPPKDYKRIEDMISEQEWKLERDGFRVVSLPSEQRLAEEIYTWAQPSISA